jgi:hypothetical protein
MTEHETLAPYEETLLADLLAFQAEQAPEPAPAPRRGVRRRRVLIAVGIAAVIGAAVAGTVVVTERGGGSGAAAKPATIKSRIQRALLDADTGYVLHTSTYNGGVLRSENWQDPARFNSVAAFSDHGSVWSRSGIVYTGHGFRIETVNLTTDHWDTIDQEFPPGHPPQHISAGGSRYLPDSIRSQLADGVLVIVGREKLDGRDTIHLRAHFAADLPPQFVPPDLWVDASTYLPVQEIQHNSLTGQDSVVHFEWLPDTPENIQKTVFRPPTGFAHTVRTFNIGVPGSPPNPSSSSSYTTTLTPSG